MNIKRAFQGIFKRKKSRGSGKGRSQKQVSKSGGRKNNSSGRSINPFLRGISLFLLILLSLYMVYQGILVAIYNESKFQNVKLASGGLNKADEVWNGKDKLSILVIGVNTAEERYQQIDTLIMLEIYPKREEIVWMFLPSEPYINTEEYGLIKTKNLIVVGDLKESGKGYTYAVNNIEKSLFLKFDRYLVFDTLFLSELLGNIGDMEVRVPQEISVENQRSRFQVAVFDENKVRLNRENILDFTIDNTGGENEKLLRQQILFESIVNAPNFLHIWKLDEIVVLLEKYFASNLNGREFSRVWSYIKKKNSPFNSVYLDTTGLTEEISSEGETIKVMKGAYLSEFIRENSLNQDVEDELARVEVFNGSEQGGAAAMYTSYFRNEGVDVIRRNNAPTAYKKSAIYVQDISRDYTETVNAIKKFMPSGTEIIEGNTDFLSTGDVIVILGDDIKNL